MNAAGVRITNADDVGSAAKRKRTWLIVLNLQHCKLSEAEALSVIAKMFETALSMNIEHVNIFENMLDDDHPIVCAVLEKRMQDTQKGNNES